MKKSWRYAVSYAEEAGCTAPILLTGNIFEALQKASLFGYDAIEIHTRENALDIEKVLEFTREKNISISMIATGRLFTEGKLSLTDGNAEIREKALAGMKMYIDMAALLNAGIIIGWAKGNLPADVSRDEFDEILYEQLKVLNDYAKLKAVPINLEVINHYEVNVFVNANDLMEFLEKYDLNNCYVHLDTYHMGLEEVDPYKALRRCKGRLGYIHVADNSRRYPGTGQFDFKKILAVLKEIDYKGYVSVECLPEPSGDSAAQKAIKHLIECEN